MVEGSFILVTIVWHIVADEVPPFTGSIWVSPNTLGKLDGGPYPNENPHAVLIRKNVHLYEAERIQMDLIKCFEEVGIRCLKELIPDD